MTAWNQGKATAAFNNCVKKYFGTKNASFPENPVSSWEVVVTCPEEKLKRKYTSFKKDMTMLQTFYQCCKVDIHFKDLNDNAYDLSAKGLKNLGIQNVRPEDIDLADYHRFVRTLANEN